MIAHHYLLHPCLERATHLEFFQISSNRAAPQTDESYFDFGNKMGAGLSARPLAASMIEPLEAVAVLKTFVDESLS